MPLARKAADLQRDPPDADAQLFRADIGELVLVGLNEARDRLAIEHWHEGRGLLRDERH